MLRHGVSFQPSQSSRPDGLWKESSRYQQAFNMPAARRKRYQRVRQAVALLALIVLAWTLWHEIKAPSYDFHAHTKVGRGRQRYRSRQKRRLGFWPGWRGVNQIFAFGDSHTETGFNPSGAQPNINNPLGNPPWPGNTGCYGPNWLGHLTASMNESLIRTYNFARNASTLQSRWTEDGLQSLSLNEQIESQFFKHYGQGTVENDDIASGRALWKFQRSLFIFYAGIDEATSDFLERVGARNTTDIDLSMEAYEAGLEQVFAYGARNFLIVGPPALEESPRIRLSDVPNSAMSFGSELVDLSGRIAFMAQSFANDHPEATVFFFNNLKYAILSRSSVKNFPETAKIKREEGYCFFYSDRKEVIDYDAACKNELTEFYWRDDVHQTEPYNRLMARLMVEEMKDRENNALPYEFY